MAEHLLRRSLHLRVVDASESRVRDHCHTLTSNNDFLVDLNESDVNPASFSIPLESKRRTIEGVQRSA